MSGLKTLYNLLLKDAVKRSGQASGIMSIGDSVRKIAEKRLQSFLLSAKKQGVDLDKLSEQELRYIIELNKPQKPKIISADSPEGKGITEALLGKRGQVIEGNFGKPFAKEAENKKNIAAMKKRKMIEDAVDNASPGFVKGDRKYNAQLVAEDLADKKFGKEFDDLDQKQQMDLYDDALEGLSEQTRGMPDPEDFATGGRAGYKFGIGPLIELLSKTSPKQAYTKYLKSVKDRAQKGDMKSLAPELGAISATGIFVNRRMKDVLENMKNQDIENNLENFKKELDADPFYKEYPELKDKMIEGYTEMMFGEKRADGGRAGFSEGNGVADEDAKNARFARRVRELMDEGFDMGEAVREAMKEGYADGGRIGYKVGSIDKARRAFLKAAAGVGAGIGALKTGLLGFGKGADAVKNLPPIKTPVTKLEGTTTQMPEWFPSFINKFRNEGKAKDVFKQKKVEVSKAEFDQAFKEGKGENYYTDVARTPEYKANNPDHMDYFKLEDTDERIFTTYTNDKVPGVRVDDMDGNVDVMFENAYSQPVSLNYTAPGKRGPETGRADLFVQGEAKIETKPKGEFVANDVEVYATDPDGGFDTEDVIAGTVDDMLEGTTRQMEEYATGKKTKLSRGEGRIIEAEIRAEQASDAAAEAAAEAADEFASGGIARMLGE